MMSNYHDQLPDDAQYGFNLSFDKNIAQLTIERLSAENARLRLHVQELQDKIARLINESCEGEEL